MRGKRRDIARAANGLFYRDGFEAVGIDRLVAEAKVALGTLYRHFGGRSEVVVAALEERHAEFLEALEHWRSRRPGEDPVLGLFDALGEWAGRMGGNGCLFLRAASSHPHDPAIVAASAGHKRAYLALLKRRLVDGGRGTAEAERLAPALFVLLEGAVAAAFTLGDRAAVAHARATAEMLLRPSGRGDR